MNLFAKYFKALEPESLFDVVPENVLQVLLRGFFYADRVGMTLLYKDNNARPDDRNAWLQLEPMSIDGKREIREYWNPACRKFRQYSHCDSECRKCDKKNANRIFGENPECVDGYKCHLGLWDFAYAIKLAGRPIGVLFAGQMAEEYKGDEISHFEVSTETEQRLQMLFSPILLATEIASIRQKMDSAKAEDKAKFEEQLEILNEAQTDPSKAITGIKIEIVKNYCAKNEIEKFRNGLEAFCKAVQQSIDELYKAKLQELFQQAILNANENLSQGVSVDPDSWILPAEVILEDLELLTGNRPLFFLVRRKSRYYVLAASTGCKQLIPIQDQDVQRSETSISVSQGIELPDRTWHKLHISDNKFSQWRADLHWLPKRNLWTYRIDDRTGVNNPLSVVLVVLGDPPAWVSEHMQRQQKEFIQKCAEAIAHHAHIGSLFARQHSQQQDFARHVAFTGHHLKTPLQNAFITLYDIARLGDMDQTLHEQRLILCDEVRKQLGEALADALMLQATTKAQPEFVDLHSLITSLLVQFAARTRERGNPIWIQPRPRMPIQISAIPAHLRTVFTNLLDNAVKYSFANQAIRIMFSPISKHYVQVVIVDVGTYYRPKAGRKIFQFAQRGVILDKKRERPGQGIGLSQTVNLITNLGGTFNLQSVPLAYTRDGTTIAETSAKVTLPIIS